MSSIDCPPETSTQVQRPYLVALILQYKKFLIWFAIIAAVLAIAIAVKEVTTLVLMGYALAVLLDPFVSKLERRGASRSFAVVLILLCLVAFFLILFLTAVPTVIEEYSRLVDVLPSYIQDVSRRFLQTLQRWGIEVPGGVDQVQEQVRQYLTTVSWDQLKFALLTVGRTLLKGYSFTLTIINHSQ